MRALLCFLATLAVCVVGGCGAGRDNGVHYFALSAESSSVMHGNQSLESDHEIREALKLLAARQDPEAGYPGPNEQRTNNVFCLHLDANTSAARVWNLVGMAAEAGFDKYMVGIAELTAGPPEGGKAPVFESPPAGYQAFMAPELKATALPVEQITVYVLWDDEQQIGGAVVAIDARGRKPVRGSFLGSGELLPPQGASPAGRALVANLRGHWVSSVCAAVEQCIEAAGAKVGRLELAQPITPEGKPAELGPWIHWQLAWQALHRVNANRASAGRARLEIVLPFHKLRVPAPPGQPPEIEVEFPKDEPAQPDPAEDERIVEPD